MFNSLLQSRFIFKESKFDAFYNDVRSGVFPEYKQFWPFKSLAADPGYFSAPTKDELREHLFGEEWQALPPQQRGLMLREAMKKIQPVRQETRRKSCEQVPLALIS